MDNITSLNKLIEVLKQSNVKDYVKIAKNMNIPIDDFIKYAHWKESGYARNCIFKTETFELILICWNKADTTAIHGHNNQKCWVYLVDGKMAEIRYQKDEKGNLSECNRIELSPGNLTYMHDSMGYHSIVNSSKEKAMTLHLYMRPIENCVIYDSEKEHFKEKMLSFHTLDGKLVL
ncbi:MAG: cysteine dioxygenase family protein [Flavobacteriales bacterium]|nr:cysteine dioxygenase family protein [Flavobacteriales bacterium]NQX97686.1 cysteine dioxygenase family protein [Flavobacteriales bacterium]